MSKPEEVIQQIKAQRHPSEECQNPSVPEVLTHPGIMEQEMVDLHVNLEALLPETPHKVIQFLASNHGEGVSTIVREYAWLVTAQLGKSALIIDACHSGGGQRAFFGVEIAAGWEQAVQDLVAMEGAITQVGRTSLYVSSYSCPPTKAVSTTTYTQMKTFFARLREKFDFVLIDSPPATTGTTVIYKHCVDGVILVVEAERTRWPVVENVRKKILDNGNSILGMVLNKRRNHVPDWIYKRL